MTTKYENTRLRLESLIEISRLLMSAVEPEEMLRAVLDAGKRIFSVEACSIALIEEDGDHLRFASSIGGADVREFRIGMGQGILGWAARKGEGIISNNVAEDDRFFRGVDEKTGFSTRSALCAPLKKDGRTLGAIEVLNTASPGGFTGEDLRLLEAFAGLAATAIHRAKAFAATRNSNLVFQELIEDRYRLIIGDSEAMQTVLRLALTVAGTNTTVLLLGESGTGKEVIAHLIHRSSPRKDHPFVVVNCAALTPELMESELFGHEKGSFTGAIAQKKGKFELADGGTVFLDEIGELPPHLQTKLLRVLQEREFQRVGGNRNIRTDVRILSATNRDLARAVQTGGFREDLFYRLNVIAIPLPPLRDRREDIPDLVRHFIRRFSDELKRPPLGIHPSAMKRLESRPWPGNVRELQNAIERAVTLCPGPEITESDLPPQILDARPSSDSTPANPDDSGDGLNMVEALDRTKRELVQRALKAAGGNQAQAARALGMQRSNLSRLMKSLGIR